LAIFMVFCTDDAPKGNYWEMKRQGTMPEVSAAVSFRQGALNLNTWILFLQYAGCFGVELTMNNGTFIAMWCDVDNVSPLDSFFFIPIFLYTINNY
jgi:nitrate/nitrite transporter NarK